MLHGYAGVRLERHEISCDLRNLFSRTASALVISRRGDREWSTPRLHKSSAGPTYVDEECRQLTVVKMSGTPARISPIMRFPVGELHFLTYITPQKSRQSLATYTESSLRAVMGCPPVPQIGQLPSLLKLTLRRSQQVALLAPFRASLRNFCTQPWRIMLYHQWCLPLFPNVSPPGYWQRCRHACERRIECRRYVNRS